jgi:hypothetical protein
MASSKNTRPIHEIVIDGLSTSVLLCEAHRLVILTKAILEDTKILKDNPLPEKGFHCEACGRSHS